LKGFFGIFDRALSWLEELGPSLAVDIEAKDLGLVVVHFWWQYHSVRVLLQKHMREACAET